MKTFSYIALSLTLALAFCLWLPSNLSFTIIWMGTAFLGLPLLIADVIALIYLIRHRKEKGVKGLAVFPAWSHPHLGPVLWTKRTK